MSFTHSVSELLKMLKIVTAGTVLTPDALQRAAAHSITRATKSAEEKLRKILRKS
jgi:hypothetical protein